MATTSTKIEIESRAQQKLLQLASARHTTLASLLQEAVEQYVDRAEAHTRLCEEASAAWTHYETTGLHLTAEEADAWLAKLEAGEDAAPPPCHV